METKTAIIEDMSIFNNQNGDVISWIFKTDDGEEIKKYSNISSAKGLNFFKNEINKLDDFYQPFIKSENWLLLFPKIIGSKVKIKTDMNEKGYQTVLVMPIEKPKSNQESFTEEVKKMDLYEELLLISDQINSLMLKVKNQAC